LLGGLFAATALGIVPGRVVARRPVRIGPVRSIVGVKYARARHSAVTMRGTSSINFRFSSHPCVPLVQWLKRHGLCRCCDRQSEHYGEKPHYSFLLTASVGSVKCQKRTHLNKARSLLFQSSRRRFRKAQYCADRKPSLAEGFLGSEILFQFADASLLPLVAQNLGGDKSQPASLMTSGLIAVPQLVVVLLAPWVGYLSESMGRKPLLLIGFAVEVARAVLLGLISNYSLLLLALAETEFGLSRETDGPACWNFAGLNSLGISSVVRIAERPRFGVYFRCSVICVFSVFGNSRAVRLLVGDCG
jgi:hypothetical protein